MELIKPSPHRTTTLEICAAICTHDRPISLRRTLRSLISQTVTPSEILVVDNAPSSGDTRRLIRNEFPTVRYVKEPTPGLDFARNRALNETAKKIVAFLDDDVVADPDWTAAIESVFLESEKIVICTGKVRAYSLKTEGQRLFEANGGFARGDKRIHLPADRKQRLRGLKAPLIAWSISIGSGCSLAVKREAVINLGGFDEALDIGTILPGGGDLDILWRTLDSGYEVVY
jgi:GT2 family glycosyltransferase